MGPQFSQEIPLDNYGIDKDVWPQSFTQKTQNFGRYAELPNKPGVYP